MNICQECRVVDGHRMGCSQRLVEVIAAKDARIKELEDALKETHDISEIRGTKLIQAEAEIARLRKALEFIASSIPTGTGYSHAYLAKKTLENGE